VEINQTSAGSENNSPTQNNSKKYHLIWVYPDYILKSFNNAPRLEVTRGLRALGWDVDFLTCGPSGVQNVEGVEVLCFNRPEIYFWGQMIAHFHMIGYIQKQWKATHIILFQQISLPWMLFIRLLHIFSWKPLPLFVMDTRTVPMETKGHATVKDQARGLFQNIMNRLANRFTDGQTVITRRMAEYLSIPPQKLWGIWTSGVSITQFSDAQRDRIWPIGGDPLHLVYIGMLTYERNLLELCEAVQLANQQGTDFSLLFVGDGPARKELEAYCLKTGGKIDVYPPVPHDQIPKILALTHIGVLPFPDEIKFQVSSPIKLFEYLASGMPILATRIVCHTDVIGNEDCAFWAETASVDGILQALQTIWDQRAKIRAMGTIASKLSFHWTWEESSGRLGNALENGIQNRLRECSDEQLRPGIVQ
jgi:glycosyltransferase involved in cell wall biosynthesis